MAFASSCMRSCRVAAGAEPTSPPPPAAAAASSESKVHAGNLHRMLQREEQPHAAPLPRR